MIFPLIMNDDLFSSSGEDICYSSWIWCISTSSDVFIDSCHFLFVINLIFQNSSSIFMRFRRYSCMEARLNPFLLGFRLLVFSAISTPFSPPSSSSPSLVQVIAALTTVFPLYQVILDHFLLRKGKWVVIHLAERSTSSTNQRRLRGHHSFTNLR